MFLASFLWLALGVTGGDDTAQADDRWSLSDPKLAQDFPDLCLDRNGIAWVAYIRHDGKADTVRLARKTDRGLEDVEALGEPGVAHQPAIACDGSGALWVFWGQLGSKNIVNLRARSVRDGKPAGPILTLAESEGSDSFADAGTDASGRVWVVWQSTRHGSPDVYARYYDPKEARWSAEIPVTTDDAGDWEPRVAFDGKDGAWVVYDSSRGDEFNVYAARVGLDGKVDTKKITDSPYYEARVSVDRDASSASKDNTGSSRPSILKRRSPRIPASSTPPTSAATQAAVQTTLLTFVFAQESRV